MRVEEGFQQPEPEFPHPFLDDSVLPSAIRRLFPSSCQDEVMQELTNLGNDINGYIRQLGAQVAPPTVVQYNQFGRRVDELKTSEGWRALKRVAAKKGIVGTGYERKYGELSRVLMFMKIYMWNAESHEVSCPMAMTDGAARVLELIGTEHMKQHLLPRLLSRDPDLAYTAGQWMTERPGGSDVSHTETIATPIRVNWSHPKTPIYNPLENGTPYTLSGVKWFSSATDGQVALALAQIASSPSDSANSANPLGLGLFVVPLPGMNLALFTPDAKNLPLQPHNGMYIHRLKNKIGTHALPTAELTLEDTIGFLLVPPTTVGALGSPNGLVKPNGIRAITPVLNITRVHSAASSTGHLARCIAIAGAYARVRRVADTKPTKSIGVKKEAKRQILLAEVPLHTATLARVEILCRALTHFLFGVVRLLGRVEVHNRSTDDERRRLRLLTPVLKAFAAERAVGGMEECMAALGGLGYMEETGIGRLIRDSLVEKIWEGTTNVLALDMMRVAREDAGGSIKAFCEWSDEIVAQRRDSDGRSTESHVALVQALKLLHSLFLGRPHTADDFPQTLARPALLLVAYVATASYLLEHAAWSKAPIDTIIAERWIEEGGLSEAIRDVERAVGGGEERERWNNEIVYAGRVKL